MKLHISKSYGDKKIFDDFSLEIKEGEVLCVLAESGAGKTTLLNILAGLTPYEGSIEGFPKKVGYIFQEPRLLPNLTVKENLQYVGGRVEDIDKILQKIGLFQAKDKRPASLSGGEKQRVAIARAFLSDAKTLLLDEPFSSLDTALKIRLCKLFSELWSEKKQTTVFVTHDIEEALLLAQRIIILNNGKIVSDFRLSGGPREYGRNTQEKERILKEILSVNDR